MQSNDAGQSRQEIIYQTPKDFPFNETRLLNCNVLNPSPIINPPQKMHPKKFPVHPNLLTCAEFLTFIITLSRIFPNSRHETNCIFSLIWLFSAVFWLFLTVKENKSQFFLGFLKRYFLNFEPF